MSNDIVQLLIEYGEYCNNTVASTDVSTGFNFSRQPSFPDFIVWLKKKSKGGQS